MLALRDAPAVEASVTTSAWRTSCRRWG